MHSSRLLQKLDLPSEHLQRCVKNMIYSPQDILARSELDLQFALNIDIFTARKIIQKASLSLAPQGRTVLEELTLVTSRDRTQPLPTGCDELDIELSGGIPCSSLTEVAAHSGMGKTQFCYQLCITSLMRDSQSTVCFFDMDHSFSAERALEMAGYFLSNSEDSNAPLNLVNRIHVISVNNSHDLNHQLDCLEEHIIEHNTKLIVFDSIGSIGSREYKHDLQQRTNALGKLANTLKTLAETYFLPVVITNHLIQDSVLPKQGPVSNSHTILTSLGTNWAHAVTTRLVIETPQSIFQEISGPKISQLTIAKAPNARVARYLFHIYEGGLHWLTDKVGKGDNFWMPNRTALCLPPTVRPQNQYH